jgi:hypothetical protein
VGVEELHDMCPLSHTVWIFSIKMGEKGRECSMGQTKNVYKNLVGNLKERLQGRSMWDEY